MTEALTEPAPNPKAVLVVVMIGTFLSLLDTAVLNAALPYIVTSFGSNVEEVKWVATGFMIAAAVSKAFKNLFLLACMFTLTALIPSLMLSGARPTPPTAEED